MAGSAIVPYGVYSSGYEPNFTMGQAPRDPWTGNPTRAINLEPLKQAGRTAGRVAAKGALHLGAGVLGPVSVADVATRTMDPLKMDERAYNERMGGLGRIVPPSVLGAVANMFGQSPNSWNFVDQAKNNLRGAYNDFANLFSGGGKKAASAAAATNPTQAIKGDSAYEGFDDQYRSFASVNAEQNAADARLRAYTPAERQMLAISPNPYGTNEPYFDNAGITRAGYDLPEVKNANVYDPKVAKGMPGMNPATGIGGSGIGAALQAAAKRGDWDAVGRFYASQGQPFGGKMYGADQESDLYNRAFGPGVRSTRGRDRAANLLAARERDQTLLSTTGMQTGAQRYGAEKIYDANVARSTAANDLKAVQLEQQLDQGYLEHARKFLDDASKPERIAEMRKKSPAEQAAYAEYIADLNAFMSSYGRIYGAMDAAQGKADGGLVEGYAAGGPIQPVLNPMGNMGMPSSMADLDPVIRQYAQYVSTASQYGLQPVAFPKFMDLLGTARTQLASLPTQGGAVGFADGGAIPVAGRQVLGPGGPKSDSIPAVIDGTRPAALSDGEFVFPTEAVQFYGTDKLNKMIEKARGQ